MVDAFKALINVRDFARSMETNATKEAARLQELMNGGMSRAIVSRDENRAMAQAYKNIADYANSEIMRCRETIEVELRRVGITVR